MARRIMLIKNRMTPSGLVPESLDQLYHCVPPFLVSYRTQIHVGRQNFFVLSQMEYTVTTLFYLVNLTSKFHIN